MPLAARTIAQQGGEAAVAEKPAPGEAADKPLNTLLPPLVKEATQENYLRVFKWVTSHASYSPYSNDLRDVAELVDANKYAAAQKKLAKGMPNLLLSPRAHLYAARAAEGLGDRKRVKAERLLARRCIEGILSTGDGSPNRPYLVTRVSDEYDVLDHLGKEKSQQGLRREDGKSYDMIQCTDGSLLCFDITVVFGAINR
jgi:hypothetical protein